MNALATRHDFPLVVYCATGKDGTGLLIAMLDDVAGLIVGT